MSRIEKDSVHSEEVSVLMDTTENIKLSYRYFRCLLISDQIPRIGTSNKTIFFHHSISNQISRNCCIKINHSVTTLLLIKFQEIGISNKTIFNLSKSNQIPRDWYYIKQYYIFTTLSVIKLQGTGNIKINHSLTLYQ